VPTTFLVHAGQSTGSHVLATFVDTNPFATAADFAHLSVNWGGALLRTPRVSLQLVSRSALGSLWKVMGSATYAQAGLFSVTVNVTDADGSTLTSKRTIFDILA
jgi:hypothetical protein